MAFRIDTTDLESTTLITVQGQLVGDAVAEFHAVLDRVTGPQVIDLGLLQTADAEAIRLLVAAANAGAELLNPSPYLQLLIERERTRTTSPRHSS